jgi:beta-ketoacyl-acyl-carrier-protein synthase II
MNMSRRVVVSGAGVIAPIGIGKENFWKGMISGKSAVGTVTDFDTSEFKAKIAAQVKDFDPVALGLTEEEANRMDRYVQFALSGATMAVDDAKLDFDKLNRNRIGVCLANAICGTKYMEEEFLRVTNGGKDAIDPSKVRPDLYDASMFNTPSTEISARFGLRGVSNTLSTGCTAGTDAFGFAYECIQDGDVDIMIAGASEAPITPITFASFDVINALSTRNDDPQRASRPFDKDRDGFIISEACGILIVEELEHALARGAHIYCEIAGFGTSCNAYHMTDLPPDGDALLYSIRSAMDNGRISPDEIDYISAHGSSTPQNDVFETNAYKSFFGERAYDIPMSSIKSMMGHPLAAANSVELVACAQIFERNMLPPTINYEVPDPSCDLDYVPNVSREAKIDTILKTSSGFSGIHSSTVLRRWV